MVKIGREIGKAGLVPEKACKSAGASQSWPSAAFPCQSGGYVRLGRGWEQKSKAVLSNLTHFQSIITSREFVDKTREQGLSYPTFHPSLPPSHNISQHNIHSNPSTPQCQHSEPTTNNHRFYPNLFFQNNQERANTIHALEHRHLIHSYLPALWAPLETSS